MAKKNAVEVHEEEFFDFSAMDNSYDEETMVGIMSGMLEASNNQMMMAIELTKLIVANNPVKNMEDHVFSVFKRATKVVGENFALKNIMEQMGR
ncbi:MAG: hypothetical protein P4M12_11445 [Gammaproteobacteria bacterium]|nr:hypothetical protein [Gammaproteobacteria bacterium]